MFGTSASLAASSTPIMPFRRASATSLRTAESRTLVVEGESASIEARYSMNSAGVSGRPAASAKRSSRAVALRIIWRKSLSAIWRKLFTCLNSWSCRMKTESWRCLAFLCSNRILNRTGRFVL